MTKPKAWKIAGVVFVLCTATAIPVSAQGFTTLVIFEEGNGATPYDAFIQGTDGNLYATTFSGGQPCYCGKVIQMSPSGTVKSLDFGQTDSEPYGGLIQSANGTLYGATSVGGVNGEGEVFQLSPAGKFITLYSFCAQPNCSDGAYPVSGLAYAADGKFYGTTSSGGDINCNSGRGCGTVFRLTPNGELTTLHSFAGADGDYPGYGPLIQATDGNLYGTTYFGGTSNLCTIGCGTLFKVSLSGTFTTIYNFCSQPGCSDGEVPSGGLVQATDGGFYGTTQSGGADEVEACNGVGCGTVFRIAKSGTLTTIHDFQGSDGQYPYSGLVQGTDGNFYGTTYEGGDRECTPYGICGTVFQMKPNGSLTSLHTFDVTDGDGPVGGLMQSTNGMFYGTTSQGGFVKGHCGVYGCGTAFSIDMGLGPFVKTQSDFGRVGSTAIILGTNLTGATSVNFNGSGAVFKVSSSSEIKATVPTGATTGYVTVTTPSGTLTSNVPFQVLK